MFTIKIIPYELRFISPVVTSRGSYETHQVWYVVFTSNDDPSHWGIGECAPLYDLSCDAFSVDEYEHLLRSFCSELEQTGILNIAALQPYPSMLFGLETALAHYESKTIMHYNTPFSEGKEGILINGLVWMGGYMSMKKQIDKKLEDGFRCIKLKIGAINFEGELDLIRHIRQNYSSDQVTLRVDANGAFSVNDVWEKLHRLSAFDLHSIEQPIKAGQWEEMGKLCKITPLSIALDEELIGCNDSEQKKRLIETIKPQYITLKPSLHGGISGCNEWIEIAKANNVGWWITSALESNVGLNAIAQWCATLQNPLPQGLGSGQLYSNNIEMPLSLKGDLLWFDPNHKPLSFPHLI